MTSSMPLSSGAEWNAEPSRLAGTIRQYSKNAIPQLTRITANSGEDLYFRCPYQAKVMKILEASSSRIGTRRSNGGMEAIRGGGGTRRRSSIFTALVQCGWHLSQS